jgi:hypothetical protein
VQNEGADRVTAKALASWIRLFRAGPENKIIHYMYAFVFGFDYKDIPTGQENTEITNSDSMLDSLSSQGY